MKKNLYRIILAGVLFIIGLLLQDTGKTDLILAGVLLPNALTVYVLSFLIVGADVVWEAIKNIFKGRVFDENFLMSIATIGAFCIGEYPEGVAVMLFYQIGELFQDYAVNRSRKSIADLMDIRPEYAKVKRQENFVKVSPSEVRVGEVIQVIAGERIPLDGKVTKGEAMLDTAALTGESMPRDVKLGDEVISGCINVNGVLEIEVLKEYGESTVSKILDLVENASNQKSRSENFITRFAEVYTPIVVIIALLLAIIPPLFVVGQLFADWVYRGLTFLVVSCPCALVISIPLSFFGGIGGASRNGVLVKGGNYLEALARTEVVAFDKTGTLTKGVFEVQKVIPCGITKEELLEIAAYAECYSNHPISLSLKRAYNKEIDAGRIEAAKDYSGKGVEIFLDGKRVLAGNQALLRENGVAVVTHAEHAQSADMTAHADVDVQGTEVFVALEGAYVGRIVIADSVKEDAVEAIELLKAAGIKKTVMLTGDSAGVAKNVAQKLNLEQYRAELLPGEKVDEVEKLMSGGRKLAFVGDGINDAPVLARADIGIAMGGLGSDAAIEAADIVIMTDEPSKIAKAIKIAKKTLRIANENIVFALGVKVFVLVLSAIGVANMWEAVFADVGVAVIAIINSMRSLKK